jgi:hypothetical protein
VVLDPEVRRYSPPKNWGECETRTLEEPRAERDPGHRFPGNT